MFFQLQRDQYARALRMIREAHGENDVRQVQPLLGIGNTYREERNPASMGISALEDALAMLLEQPQRDPVATAMALRDIGDWAVAFGKTGYAGTEYQRAWQMLGSAPNGDAAAPRVVHGRELRAVRADQPARLEHRSRRAERARHGHASISTRPATATT